LDQGLRLLFVHQNMPGQYRELLQWLVAQNTHEIAFLTQRKTPPTYKGVRTAIYKPHHVAGRDAYGLSKVWETATGTGLGAAKAARALEEDHGFKPDIVIGHVGWGELTFFKQVWPDVPIIGYFEYFYQLDGGIVGFEPQDKVSADTPFLLAARNAVPLANIEVVDQGQCPTQWQQARFPQSFHTRMYLCHDGIRTDMLRPDAAASVPLSRLGRMVTREDEIITYVARNLERVRGFHCLMRALPDIQRARPNARILIVGGSDVSYGAASETPGGLRAEMEAELGAEVDWSRTHFLGPVSYGDFVKIIQVSRCHIYLTMPFVLSWSLMEAMAMEATIVASDVAPVREMIAHGENGLLVDFHHPDQLAAQVIDVLSAPGDYQHLGPAARYFVRERHDFLTRCLPEHLRQINALVPSAKHVTLP